MSKLSTAYALYRVKEAARTRAGARGRASPGQRAGLVPLDTGAIRRKALQEHRKAERGLEQLRSQLKRFHEQDIPAFNAWIHRAFGPLLTRQRELTQEIEAKRSLVLEIQILVDRYGLEEGEAYRKVLWRRAHPEEAAEEDRQFEEAVRKQEEAIFGSAVDDEDFEIPQDEWDEAGDFFEQLTGIRLPSGARHDRGEAHADEKTVKELYRAIVRRLHPDHHGQMNDARASLWHEAQEAYGRRDLDALHSVLARCDGGDARFGAHSPVSLIRRLTRQLKQAAQALRSEVRRAKMEVAWDLEQKVMDYRFVRRIQHELERDISTAEYQLAAMTRFLTTLERDSRRAAPPVRRRKPAAHRNAASNRQPKFPF